MAEKTKYITDDMGHEFESLSEMCSYYNIDKSRFVKRILSGMSIKEALQYVEPSMKRKDIQIILGDRILEERIFHDKKQTEFGIEIGESLHNINDRKPISEAMISAFENGRKFVGLERLKLISDYFNLPIDYMLGLYNYRETLAVNDLNGHEMFCKRLKSLRKQLGKTQQAVCKEMTEREDINIKSIMNVVLATYENGSSEPPLARIIEFAKYYECSVAYLCGQTDTIDRYREGTEPDDVSDEITMPYYRWK